MGAAAEPFRPDSELSRLNARSGQPVVVSGLLFDVLSAAVRAAHATAGLYDPTLLRTLEHLGYDRSFEQLADRTPTAPGEAPAGGGWRRVMLDQRMRTVTLPAEVGVDLGGITKAWRWARPSSACAPSGCGPPWSAPGETCGCGLPPDLDCWPIAVDGARGPVTVAAHPWVAGDLGDRPATLAAGSGRASSPARPAPRATLQQRTVVGHRRRRDLRAGGGRRKTAFILGPTAGIAFLDSKGLAGLLVGRSGGSWRCGSWPASPDHRQEAACSPASR